MADPAAQYPWHLDELNFPGINYADPTQADAYEARHAQYSDRRGQHADLLDRLAAEPGQRLLDIGTGPGLLARMAAERGLEVDAVDVSPAMVELARKKAVEAGREGIRFHVGGFLTYDHTGEPADVVSTSLALHHLPDFWKTVALMRVNRMMRMGGRLGIFDVIYSFEPGDYAKFLEQRVQSVRERLGERWHADLARHIRNEYSTFLWLMEAMLERTGFRVVATDPRDGFHAIIIAEKIAEAPTP